MTLGEIKIEALRLMFANANEDIDASLMEIYRSDDNYRDYLGGMPGAINRCFAEIEKRGILPSKSCQLTGGTRDGCFTRFSPKSLVPDFGEVDRLVYTCGAIYDPSHPYRMEGDVIVTESVSAGETYILLYKPRITRITSSTDEQTVIDVPENIAAAIPYYIKGDLFRDDEPNEAGEARNWFEAAIENIPRAKEQYAVRDVYAIEDF